ncbi:HNH endonuclease, partial [Anaeromicropila populeti]|uniref:HNH endonuclease n=1 Tax=Anaeromicropila populeti TaxID=37658 RepID=UPI000B015342
FSAISILLFLYLLYIKILENRVAIFIIQHQNGICLNSLHDKAFDRGLITITQDFRILVSNAVIHAEMDEKTRGWFMSYNHRQICLPDKFLPAKDFIEYHNDMIFQR